jgi:hypothetical protein
VSDRLETLVGRALREVPLRRAPPSLEARVLREIGRLASLPWWRRSFSRWPRPARVGFTLTCGSIIAAVLGFWPWIEGGALADAAARSAGSWVPWARPALILVDLAGQLDSALTGAIPPGWLYAALSAGAILYAALFGLGAVAYQTLYLKSFSAGESRS